MCCTHASSEKMREQNESKTCLEHGMYMWPLCSHLVSKLDITHLLSILEKIHSFDEHLLIISCVLAPVWAWRER